MTGNWDSAGYYYDVQQKKFEAFKDTFDVWKVNFLEEFPKCQFTQEEIDAMPDDEFQVMLDEYIEVAFAHS